MANAIFNKALRVFFDRGSLDTSVLDCVRKSEARPSENFVTFAAQQEVGHFEKCFDIGLIQWFSKCSVA